MWTLKSNDIYYIYIPYIKHLMSYATSLVPSTSALVFIWNRNLIIFLFFDVGFNIYMCVCEREWEWTLGHENNEDSNLAKPVAGHSLHACSVWCSPSFLVFALVHRSSDVQAFSLLIACGNPQHEITAPSGLNRPVSVFSLKMKRYSEPCILVVSCFLFLCSGLLLSLGTQGNRLSACDDLSGMCSSPWIMTRMFLVTR